MVDEESIVRTIDKFIDMCDLNKLGFTRTRPAATGRPSYPPGPLVKLYVYGYENGIRSSRKLERECNRNLEAMWLMEGLTPDYSVISEFRRLNIRPLQKLFKEFLGNCVKYGLIGGETFVVDGTKVKASNNKKNNYSRKKLEARLQYLEEKTTEYLAKLDEEDKREDAEGGDPEGLADLLKRKDIYKSYLEQLDKTGEGQLSTVDPDARLMGNNRGGVEMAYNVQSVVDAKHHLIMDLDVSMNPTDQGQFSNMAKRLIRQGYRKFTLLADKGYYNGKCLQKGKKYKIKAIVSRQAPPKSKGQPKSVQIDKFLYDRETDSYTCPAGEVLHSHSEKTAKQRIFYNKEACSKCPIADLCVNCKDRYRTITRGVYADIFDEADRAFIANKDMYRLRQQIIEHPFGTIKRTMDGGYFLLRSRRKVRTEVALLFLGYNLKRVYNVLGFKEFMAKLDSFANHILLFLRVLGHFYIEFAFIA